MAYLIDNPTTYCVLQGGYGDVFANHRLKSQLTLHTSNMRLTDSNVVEGLYREATLEYIENFTQQLRREPPDWLDIDYRHARLRSDRSNPAATLTMRHDLGSGAIWLT